MKPKELEQADTGRKAYREPHEHSDGRPLIINRPFWESFEEQEAYERAVRQNPRGNMPPGAYIAKIAAIVTGRLEPAGKAMPHAPGRRATERRIAALEEQREEVREPGEDG